MDKNKGRRTKDEERRTKDDKRKTKDERRRTKDEGRKIWKEIRVLEISEIIQFGRRPLIKQRKSTN